MRPLAGLATVLICAAASTAAGAQNLSTQSSAPTDAGAAAILNRAAFAPKSFAGSVDPISALIERETYVPGQGPERWTSGQVQLSHVDGGPVDSLRVSIGGILRTPGGVPLNLSRAQYE